MKIENIKFKAKRLDNGEWVEGDLNRSTSYVGIGYPSSEFPDVPIVHRVDPATVCQFTGMKDREGNEIYEGDVLDGYPECEIVFTKGTFATRSIDYNGNVILDPLYYFQREDGTVDGKVVGNKFDKEK